MSKANDWSGLERAVVDRLRSLRGPGESNSDVILRMTAAIWSAAHRSFGRALRATFLRKQALHSAVEFSVILPKGWHPLDQVGKREPQQCRYRG
jgi:hypothetical protein